MAGATPESGRAILERIADGDPGAMTDLIDKYGDLVWSLARRYFGASPVAQDSVQEAFLLFGPAPGGSAPTVAAS